MLKRVGSNVSKARTLLLMNRGGIRTVMVTGDYHYTAIAVAKDIGMIQPDQEIMIIDVANQKDSASDDSACRTSSSASPWSPPAGSHGPPLSVGLPHQSPTSILQAWGDRVQGLEAMAGVQGGAGTGVPGAGLGSRVQPGEGSLPGLNSVNRFVSPAGTDPHALDMAPFIAPPTARPIAPPPAPPTAPMLVGNPLQRPSEVLALVAPSRQALQGQGPGLQEQDWELQGQGQGLLEQGKGLQKQHEQLKVVTGLGGEEVGLRHAMQSMASGHSCCAITGSAFAHLLQMSDLSILETVMHSAVVFARMKPHQKGQMIDLLSVRGLHQMHLGCARYIQGWCILLLSSASSSS